MPRPAVLSVKILEGRVSLYKTKVSPFYQCSFKMGGKHIRTSTKTADLTEAKDIATELYVTARIKDKEGIPVVTRSFKSVAELAIARMKKALADGSAKNVYQNYIDAINNYLIPFFGKRSIDKIDHATMLEYTEWRNAKCGRVPSKSTVNHHIIAMNKVFDLAVEKKFVTRSQLPELHNDGRKSERRPDFTMEDYRTLYTKQRKWINEGRAGAITVRRHILRDYVLFLANVGCRPGTETKGLKWKHFRFEMQGGVEYILITINGKTGPREVVARHAVIRPLERLLQRQTAYKNMSVRDAIKQKLDAYVFAEPNGKEWHTFKANFKVLMKDTGLLHDPRSGEERTLYSLRHFYITQRLLNNVSPAVVAKQCGTSIAMLDQYYSHVTALLAAKDMAGRKDEERKAKKADLV